MAVQYTRTWERLTAVKNAGLAVFEWICQAFCCETGGAAEFIGEVEE